MPIANVSQIVGKRDLVAEAQGWADIYLRRKKMEAELAEEERAKQPKPYDFSVATFGTKNENMLKIQEDLNDQAYEYAMANTHLLNIDPRSEDCGPECKNAHRTLHNMQGAASTFNTYGDDLKQRYDALAELMRTDPDNYDNAENHQRLEDMKNIWENGMGGENFTFSFADNGRLVVNTRKRNKTQKIKTDLDGRTVFQADGVTPVYLYQDANCSICETDDPTKAALDGNGNPIPIMVDMDTGQETDWETGQLGFADWLTDLGFSDKIVNANSSNFSNTNKEYANLVFHDGQGNYQDYEKKSHEALEFHIFGNNGYWDDRTGTGRTNGHSKYLEVLVRQDKGPDHIITKADLVQKAYELGHAHQTGQTTTDKKKQVESIYNFEVSTIGGTDFNQDLVYDKDNNYILSQTQNPDYKTDISESSHTFEGSYIDTGETGYVNLNVQVNPKEVTLISGDSRFKQVENTNQLSSYLDQATFRTNTYGVALFYKGRAISDEAYLKLSDEEKKNVSYERALYGEMLLPKADESYLLQMGIISKPYKTTADGEYIVIPAITKANRYDRRIGGLGASKEGQGTINENMIKDAELLRKQKNLMHQCSLNPDFHADCKKLTSGSSSSSGSNINTGVYNQ
tara:strand:+ start:902 stop:2785 length:1884 start_codon:yes stop_codon:yes gene_type:complete